MISELDRLQEMHSQLRKAKFFYYELHDSLMTDYEFDMLEKEYVKLAGLIGILDKHNMATEFVGFDAVSPMNLNHFYKEVTSILIFTADNCPPCKRLLKILDSRDKTQVSINIVNVKDNKDLVDKYSIRASPTTVYLDKYGEIITKSFGSTSLPTNLKYVGHFG